MADGDDDIFASSTSTLSFEKFIATINQPSARDLVKSINVFMKNFREKPPDSASDSQKVQEFMASMEQAFARHPLWAGCSQEDLDAAVEGLEKYLLTKLYDRTFAQDIMDRERDQILAARLAALQFIRPEHLEIADDFANDGAMALAQKELKKINMYKSPRDKLVCVLNCCKVITNLLASRRYGAGADDLTPVLIYVTIKAQPEYLASNLAFIERYRTHSRLVSESQYFFVQMQGAATFIETLTTSSLKVDPDELLAHMLAAGALTDQELEMMSKASAQSRKTYDTGPPQPQAPTVDLLGGYGSQDQQQTMWTGAQVAAEQQHWRPPPPPPPPPPPAPGGGASTAVLIDMLDYTQPFSNPLLAQPQPHFPPPSQQQYQHPPGVSLPLPPPPPPPPPPQYPPGPVPAPPPPPPPSSYYAATAAAPMSAFDDLQQMAAAAQQAQQARMQQGLVQPAPPQQTLQPQQPDMPAPAPAGQPTSQQHQAHAAAATHPPLPPPPPPPPAALPPRLPLPPLPRGPKSAAELEAEGLRLVLQAEASGELQQRHPFLYSAVDRLTLSDVRVLLVQYKELALKYEAVAMAAERSVADYFAEVEEYRRGTAAVAAAEAAASMAAVADAASRAHQQGVAEGRAAAEAKALAEAREAEEMWRRQLQQQHQEQQQHRAAAGVSDGETAARAPASGAVLEGAAALPAASQPQAEVHPVDAARSYVEVNMPLTCEAAGAAAAAVPALQNGFAPPSEHAAPLVALAPEAAAAEAVSAGAATDAPRAIGGDASHAEAEHEAEVVPQAELSSDRPAAGAEAAGEAAAAAAPEAPGLGHLAEGHVTTHLTCAGHEPEALPALQASLGSWAAPLIGEGVRVEGEGEGPAAPAAHAEAAAPPQEKVAAELTSGVRGTAAAAAAAVEVADDRGDEPQPGEPLACHVASPWYEAIASGAKTVEGRLRRGAYARLGPGSTLRMSGSDGSSVVADVSRVNHYDSFHEYLEHEGLAQTLPGVATLDEGVAVYRQFYTEEEEREFGVAAIHLCVVGREGEGLGVMGGEVDGGGVGGVGSEAAADDAHALLVRRWLQGNVLCPLKLERASHRARSQTWSQAGANQANPQMHVSIVPMQSVPAARLPTLALGDASHEAVLVEQGEAYRRELRSKDEAQRRLEKQVNQLKAMLEGERKGGAAQLAPQASHDEPHRVLEAMQSSHAREQERMQQLLSSAQGLAEQLQAQAALQERQHAALVAGKEQQIAQLTQQLSNLQVAFDCVKAAAADRHDELLKWKERHAKLDVTLQAINRRLAMTENERPVRELHASGALAQADLRQLRQRLMLLQQQPDAAGAATAAAATPLPPLPPGTAAAGEPSGSVASQAVEEVVRELQYESQHGSLESLLRVSGATAGGGSGSGKADSLAAWFGGRGSCASLRSLLQDSRASTSSLYTHSKDEAGAGAKANVCRESHRDMPDAALLPDQNDSTSTPAPCATLPDPDLAPATGSTASRKWVRPILLVPQTAAADDGGQEEDATCNLASARIGPTGSPVPLSACGGGGQQQPVHGGGTTATQQQQHLTTPDRSGLSTGSGAAPTPRSAHAHGTPSSQGGNNSDEYGILAEDKDGYDSGLSPDHHVPGTMLLANLDDLLSTGKLSTGKRQQCIQYGDEEEPSVRVGS